MRFSRAYDFQRALCENPEIIGAWFRLVENIRGKYGIQDCDFYNFDETGFMMGMIQATMVVTGSKRRGRAKSVQPGNREWSTAICCVNGEGWSLPPFFYWSKAPIILHIGIQRPIYHAIGPLKPRLMDGQITRSL